MLPVSPPCLRGSTLSEIDVALASVTRQLTGNASEDVVLLFDAAAVGAVPPERSAPLLRDACRLLLRQGDSRALGRAWRISHALYSVERSLGGRGSLATLFRGLAQIGSGQAPLGTHVVARVLDGAERDEAVSPADLALGHWGLASAAIGGRNLRLASRFVADWYEAARAAGLPEEALRARMASALLDVLADVPSSEAVRALVAEAPASLLPATLLLETWASRLSSGVTEAASSLARWPVAARATREHACAQSLFSPVDDTLAAVVPPLLLGADWCAPASSTETHAARSFEHLCRVRRSAPGESLEALKEEAGLLAAWDLIGPLRAVEVRLRKLDVASYYDAAMDRLLGRHARAESLAGGLGPTTRDDVVVLMTDLRGYSSIAERMPPPRIFEFLNPLFRLMHEELEAAGGTILEFIGDAVLVVFNAFDAEPMKPEAILAAVMRCLRRVHWLSSFAAHAGLPVLWLGVGLSRGPAAVSLLGGLDRCHLAVLGNTVNTAARVESLTRVLGSQCLVHERLIDDEPWANPDEVSYVLRSLGRHAMKNIAEPPRLFGVQPLIRTWVDFVPMGIVADPEPGVVYVDCGGLARPGILDTHGSPESARSACELLDAQPALLLEHLRDVPYHDIELRLHEEPDLDCAATYYSACERLEGQPRRDVQRRLAAYVSAIDQGFEQAPERLADSLYGVFVAHLHRVRSRAGGRPSNVEMLEAGLRVVDAACYLAEANAKADFADIFARRPDWFPEERALLAEDLARYHDDCARGSTYEARVVGRPLPVTGLWLTNPKSLVFKFFARSDPRAPGGKGYGFLAVDWSTPDKARYVLSVDPSSDTNLKGLGEVLERAEAHARRALGLERPTTPRRFPADNADPWYFGQGHDFTIVDAPARGTVLTGGEVRRLHASWSPAAGETPVELAPSLTTPAEDPS